MEKGTTIEKTFQVLIVDDNVNFCMNCIDIFESQGYWAAAVYDGFQAIEAVENHDFDLVIMDIKMPIMNGVETFRRLKKISPKLPVILISAYAVEDLISSALQEGAFATFHKPLNFEKIFETIEETKKNGAMIMIVDDDKVLCENLSEILRGRGYRVKFSNNGQSALQMCRESFFEIILLDMKLPALNGLETYLKIRSLRPDVVVILITGYMNEMAEDINHALKNSAYICLEKPLDIEKLLDIVHKIQQGD